MQYLAEIVICLGSSCFARGNKETVQIIREFLKENELTAQVNFKGNHCFANCQDGPVIKINNKVYHKITTNNVLSILNEHFK